MQLHSPLAQALGSALLLALLPWIPARQDDAARPRPHRPSPEERQAALAEELMGAWQLTAATVGSSELPALKSAGYLIVQPDYLALETHLVMPSGYAVASDQPFFQSGIRRWRFDGELSLQTSTLIGCTNISAGERWDFDVPGTRSTLKLFLKEDELVLEQPGVSRLSFRRLPRMPFPGDGAESLKDERRKKEERRREDR